MQNVGGAGHLESPGSRVDLLELQGQECLASELVVGRGDADVLAGHRGNGPAAEGRVRQACRAEAGHQHLGGQELQKEQQDGPAGHQDGQEREAQHVQGQTREPQQETWELVLALLPPREIACCALACSLLSAAARNVTLQRCADACQGHEPTPVPFISGAAVPAGPNRNSPGVAPAPKYAYFQYTRTNLRKLPWPFVWGAPSPGSPTCQIAKHGVHESTTTTTTAAEFNGIPADVIQALGPTGCACSGPMCCDPYHGPCTCGLTGEGSPAYTSVQVQGAGPGDSAGDSAVTEPPSGAERAAHSDTVTREGAPVSWCVGLLQWAQERERKATYASCQGSPAATDATARSCDAGRGTPSAPQPKRRKLGSVPQERAAADTSSGRDTGEWGRRERGECGVKGRGECGLREKAQPGGGGRVERGGLELGSLGSLSGPLVFECGPTCACGPSCPHRLSQQPLHWPLEVRWEGAKGWGLFAAGHIPAGAFLCQYAGEHKGNACVGANKQAQFFIELLLRSTMACFLQKPFDGFFYNGEGIQSLWLLGCLHCPELLQVSPVCGLLALCVGHQARC